MVGPPLAPEEEQGQQEGEDLRRGNGPPDAVHIQQQRQDQHGAGLEHHGPQEGDNGGSEAVVEGRKEGGGEDVEARQQEGEGEEPEGVGGEGEERRVISHKEPGQGLRQHNGRQGQHHAGHPHEQGALPQHILQLSVVARAEVVADDGAAADGVANEDGHKDELHIHQHPVGGDAVLSHIAQKLEVVEDAHQGGGDVAHELRGAVGAGPQQGADLQPGGDQVQQAAVGPQKVDEGEDAAHALADARGDGGTGHPPAEHPDEQAVQHHVGQSRRHRGVQAQLGFLRGDEEALKYILQHERRRKGDVDAAIEDAVRQHLLSSAKEDSHRLHDQQAEDGENDPQQQGEEDHHGEAAVRPLSVPLSQDLGHQGGAAGADHEPHAPQDHDEGHHQVDGGKGGLSGEVGHEEAVHHAVDGGEDHHDDGGEDETQQLAVGEVVGQLDVCFLAHRVTRPASTIFCRDMRMPSLACCQVRPPWK